jgi:hypothetical protein
VYSVSVSFSVFRGSPDLTMGPTQAKVARRNLFLQFRVLRVIRGYLAEDESLITRGTRNHTKGSQVSRRYKDTEHDERHGNLEHVTEMRTGEILLAAQMRIHQPSLMRRRIS